LSSGTLKRGLYSQLTNNAAVAAVVGERVYSQVVPQSISLAEDGPYIAFAKTGASRDQTHDGLSGFVQTTFELHCCAANETDADIVGDAVREALCGTGYLASFGTFKVQHCKHSDERDEIEVIEGREKPIFKHVVTVEIGYQEKDNA
jgi:hypothetical protein